MVHAAVVMDDENSIIIVGERQAMDLGEILKILVNIEAEYWNRIWIDFENIYTFGENITIWRYFCTPVFRGPKHVILRNFNLA